MPNKTFGMSNKRFTFKLAEPKTLQDLSKRFFRSSICKNLMMTQE